MSICPTESSNIARAKERLITQYKNSPNINLVIEALVAEATEPVTAMCAASGSFDLENATGEQLTALGDRLGFPRCHCAGAYKPVFGFAFDRQRYACDDEREVYGMCEADFDCKTAGKTEEVCFSDDAEYRVLLKARAIAVQRVYTSSAINSVLSIIFGTQAYVAGAEPWVYLYKPKQGVNHS